MPNTKDARAVAARTLLHALRDLTPAENRAWAEAASSGDARRFLNQANQHLRAAERFVDLAIKAQEPGHAR